MKNRWILVIKLYFDKYSIVWTCSNFWKMWSSLDCKDWVLSSQLPCLLTKVLSSWGVKITGQKRYVRYPHLFFFFSFPFLFISLLLLANHAVLGRLFCQLEVLHYSGLWEQFLCFSSSDYGYWYILAYYILWVYPINRKMVLEVSWNTYIAVAPLAMTWESLFHPVSAPNPRGSSTELCSYNSRTRVIAWEDRDAWCREFHSRRVKSFLMAYFSMYMFVLCFSCYFRVLSHFTSFIHPFNKYLLCSYCMLSTPCSLLPLGRIFILGDLDLCCSVS